MTSDIGRSAQSAEPGKRGANPVRFKLAKLDKPLILLETMVDDRGPYRFVLDTGAGGTFITPKLAMKLGVNSDNQAQATGAGGQVEVHHGAVKSLKVGETMLVGLEVGIMDLTGIGKAIETDIDGLIGYSFLENYRVMIDYPKETVTFE